MAPRGGRIGCWRTSRLPFQPPPGASRCAVVDLGSNSVRLVVFEGTGRTPVTIFNEKAVLRLGRGLQASGLLNPESIDQALTVMARYHAIASAMGADPFEVLATAAVRDASNGAAFISALSARMPGVHIRVLSGEEEAALSAEGLLCGIPDADGVLADIGGGSLELVRLEAGRPGTALTLPLGVIRLAERAGGDTARARSLADDDIGDVAWLHEGQGRDLYLVGGAWRALARMHMATTEYPLAIVHHYTIVHEAARELAAMIASTPRRVLERMPGVPRRRVDDLAFAAVVLRRLLRATGAARIVFSANGLREGWYMRRLSPNVRAQDELLVAGRAMARQLGRDPAFPCSLLRWTDPLFPGESQTHARLREAACWLSDIGSHDHPEYRAEQAYVRILRQPGIGMDHPARAFLGLVMAIRYEAEPDSQFLASTRVLLTAEAIGRATILGCALRLAYTLSAGTPDLLVGARLLVGTSLRLHLTPGSGLFAGESVTRRLERLAVAMGLSHATEVEEEEAWA